MLKSYGWGGGVVGWGGVGGLCDYCVSPSPFGLDFGTLDFGTSGLGLTINNFNFQKSTLVNSYLIVNNNKWDNFY